jgi:cytochrome c
MSVKSGFGTLAAAAALVVAAWGGGAAAADLGATLYAEKRCDTCHGEDGTHPVTADYPVIAGQPVKYLVRQMRDIRDGRRTNGLSESMRAQVQGVTDEEFAVIAQWLASRW